jgi:hypothetical protein
VRAVTLRTTVVLLVMIARDLEQLDNVCVSFSICGFPCCADCTFGRTGGVEPGLSVRGDGTLATFTNCQFLNNIETDPPDPSVVVAAAGASAVWLEGCTFKENSAEHLLGDAGAARFFSDQQLTVLDMETGSIRISEFLESKPEAIQFLNMSNPWLLNVQEVRLVPTLALHSHESCLYQRPILGSRYKFTAVVSHILCRHVSLAHATES